MATLRHTIRDPGLYRSQNQILLSLATSSFERGAAVKLAVRKKERMPMKPAFSLRNTEPTPLLD